MSDMVPCHVIKSSPLLDNIHRTIDNCTSVPLVNGIRSDLISWSLLGNIGEIFSKSELWQWIWCWLNIVNCAHYVHTINPVVCCSLFLSSVAGGLWLVGWAGSRAVIGREFPPVVARLRPGCCGGQMCAGARSHGAGGELSTVTEQRRQGEHGDIRLLHRLRFYIVVYRVRC